MGGPFPRGAGRPACHRDVRFSTIKLVAKSWLSLGFGLRAFWLIVFATNFVSPKGPRGRFCIEVALGAPPSFSHLDRELLLGLCGRLLHLDMAQCVRILQHLVSSATSAIARLNRPPRYEFWRHLASENAQMADDTAWWPWSVAFYNCGQFQSFAQRRTSNTKSCSL